ncbi:GNAT family N-acetyltransferase [Haloferula chungangensis]|uniref:GNAT family N-acetyltransferase n=1 Tax=Haloferula chungangensis TaxID=1048331 RepID=A0ABW2L9R6_9BACT
MPTPRFTIELLDPARHRREEFDCGVEILNTYLKRRANQEMKALAAACYVIVPDGEPDRIAGYYTLSAATVELGKIPENLQKKLPRYDELGAVLIGRLARDQEFAKERIGEKLLMSALLRSYRESKRIGAVAILVDAKDEAASAFYKRFGFRPLTGSRLFLPMKDVPNWNPLAKEG